MPAYLDDVLARIPEERHAEFLRIVHRFNIGPESPDLIGLVLQTEVFDVLRQDVVALVTRVESAAEKLPETMRACSIPIIEHLAGEFQGQAVAGVREDVTQAVVDVLSHGVDVHEKIVINLAKEQHDAAVELAAAARRVVADSSAAVSRVEARATTIASAQVLAVERLGRWSTQRIASVALGVILLAGTFALGISWSKVDDALRCSAHVESMSSTYHLNLRERKMLQHNICVL